jgi:hypothetical protein
MSFSAGDREGWWWGRRGENGKREEFLLGVRAKIGSVKFGLYCKN